MTTRKKPSDDAEHPDPELADDTADRVAELKDEVIHAVEARLDALGKAIQKHPLLAVGIGVGIGYVLARLLRRD